MWRWKKARPIEALDVGDYILAVKAMSL